MRKFLFLLLLPIAALAAPVNTNYGRVSPSNTVDYAPAQLRLGNIVDGRVFANNVTALHPTAAQYASQGWLPIDDYLPEREGFAVEASGVWFVTNGVIRAKPKYVPLPPPPPRTFSKMRAVIALTEAGVWPEVKAWITTNGLYDIYLAAQNFKEDDPYFRQGLATLKAVLNLDDEYVEGLLDEIEVR